LTILYGPAWGPASKGKPRQLVVICHGHGSDGNDMINLAPPLSAKLPNVLFIAPHGPEPCDPAPDRRQWFSLGDLSLPRLFAGVRQASIILDGFIDAQLKTHDIKDYALLGFSQGAMTVLFNGIRRAAPPRGIISIAGALLDPERTKDEIRNHAPVLLCHGEQDDVVPALRSRQSAAVLRANGVEVETIFRPDLAHGFDAETITAAGAFLQRCFAASD
jgi:phospholipase/carboxylesterase